MCSLGTSQRLWVGKRVCDKEWYSDKGKERSSRYLEFNENINLERANWASWTVLFNARRFHRTIPVSKLLKFIFCANLKWIMFTPENTVGKEVLSAVQSFRWIWQEQNYERRMLMTKFCSYRKITKILQNTTLLTFTHYANIGE